MTFSHAPLVRDGDAGGWATFDKGVTWMGSFPRDNCPELFQSEWGGGDKPAAAHKNVTPFKARGGRLRMG